MLIPAAEGLAALVEQALGKDGVAGITADTPGRTIASLFADDVHLTKTGNYFVALLTHVVLHGALPRKTWAPDIDPAAAEALQDFAVAFLARWRLDQSSAQIECSGLSQRAVRQHLSVLSARHAVAERGLAPRISEMGTLLGRMASAPAQRFARQSVSHRRRPGDLSGPSVGNQVG